MAKKKVKASRFFVLPSGERYEVTGENGKYWLCGDTKFRKSAGRGTVEEVRPAPEPEPDMKEVDGDADQRR